jgi:hypothetical protein
MRSVPNVSSLATRSPRFLLSAVESARSVKTSVRIREARRASHILAVVEQAIED